MTWDALQVRLLGPVDVMVDGTTRTISGLRRKAVFAALGLYPGETVSTDRLTYIVWGSTPPATAANTLQSHVSHLRRVLGKTAPIVARPPGYVLDVPPEATDVAVAEKLIRRRESDDHPDQTATQLRTALSMWRGRALVDMAALPWFDEQAERLENVRLGAVQNLIEVRLNLGKHVDVAPELEALVEEHPFREPFHEQLMLALYRAGRQADALAVCRRLRRVLGEELGIEPSARIRELEAAILRQDPSLDLPKAGVVVSAPAAVRAPAQLPLATPTFTGRDSELTELDSLLAEDHATGVRASTVLISGVAGVGKTALALHWAHRITAGYPDGQLYADLRGFDSSDGVHDPTAVIHGFLEAFGLPAESIPCGQDARAGLYRSVLAGKRVLVVLDNARDTDQVRPLLPGSPGCLVVVTSRGQLTGLVATDGAHPLTLDLPSAAQARALLVWRLGLRRVEAEPAAVDDIIAHCGRLPLALAVAAAPAAADKRLSLAALAAQLHDAGPVADRYQYGDSAIGVQSSLVSAERALWVDGDLGGARRLFDTAYREAERRGDGVAMASAALGLGGLWIHEIRTAADAAMVWTRQHHAVSLIDPRSSLAFRLRARLTAEEDFRLSQHEAILAMVADARRGGDAVSLAETLSLAYECLRGQADGRQRLDLAEELIGVASQTNRRGDLLIGLVERAIELFRSGNPHAERALAELRGMLADQDHQAVGLMVSAVDVMLTIRSGRLSEAEALAAALARRGTAAEDRGAAARYAAHLATIRWYQGRIGELVPMLSHLVHSPMVSATDHSFFAVLAVAAAAAEEWSLAASMLARLRGNDLSELPRSHAWLATLSVAVEAADLLGDMETANQAYVLLAPFAHLPVVGGLGLTCLGSAQHSLGVASLTMGDLDRALEHLRAAIRENLRLGHLPAASLSRARLAQVIALREGHAGGEALQTPAPEVLNRSGTLMSISMPTAR